MDEPARSVRLAVCQAAVKNLITLPVNHPAFAQSMEHLEKLVADKRRERGTFDLWTQGP